MKALVIDQPGQIDVRTVPDPKLGNPNEVIVKVGACGLCGTDIHILKGEYIATYPVIPGHEFAGEIVEVGRDVKSYKVGDRVTANPNIYCGTCTPCTNGYANHCSNYQCLGVTRPGAFAEYLAVPADRLYHLPDNFTYTEGAMVEPAACVAYGILKIGVGLGDHVAVFGAGPIGQLLMLLAKSAGASKVVAVDLVQSKLDAAKRFGADETVLADGKHEAKLRSIAGEGFDVVIDATGVPKVVQAEMSYVRRCGRMLVFGVCPKGVTMEVQPYEIYQRELTIKGSDCFLGEMGTILKMFGNHKPDLESLVSHRLSLEEMGSFFKDIEKQTYLKVQVIPR